jgi:hypothetical protein
VQAPDQHEETMEQLSEKKRRTSLRIAIALGVMVLFWYAMGMYMAVQS